MDAHHVLFMALLEDSVGNRGTKMNQNHSERFCWLNQKIHNEKDLKMIQSTFLPWPALFNFKDPRKSPHYL